MSKRNTLPAEVENKSVASVGDAAEFEDYAGQGLENVTGRDLLIPRLTILQALSPQVNSKRGEYIKDATSGAICDVGTSELFEAPLLFLPVHFVKQWLEWAPRNTGRGLVKVHDTDEILKHCKADEKNRPISPAGNLVAETAQFFGLNLSALARRSFIPLASTQLKKARKWLTLASSEKLQRGDGSEFTPPIYYRAYNLGVAEEKNNEGEWFGWVIDRGQKLTDMANWKNLRAEALAFRDSIQSGETRGDVASMDAGEAHPAAAEEGDRM